MSTGSPATTSPSSASSDFHKGMHGGVHSPATAASVQSNHHAVSPGDATSNVGGYVFFTTEMANRAALEIEKKKFDSLLSWYYATEHNKDKNSSNEDESMSLKCVKEEITDKDVSTSRDLSLATESSHSNSMSEFGVSRTSVDQPDKDSKPVLDDNFRAASTSSSSLLQSSLEVERKPFKRKVDDSPSMKFQPDPSADLLDISGPAKKTSKTEDDNPLRRMERMTNSSVFEGSVSNSNGNSNMMLMDDPAASVAQRNKENAERTAKLEKLGEVERQLMGERQAQRAEWERMQEEQMKQAMGGGHPGLPPGIPSPIHPPPAGYGGGVGGSGPLSAGSYPPHFPAGYPFMQGPASAGAYPLPGKGMPPGARMGMMPGHPMSGFHPGMPYPPHMRPGFPGHPGMPHPGMHPMMAGMHPGHPFYQQMMAQQQAHAAAAARGMGMSMPSPTFPNAAMQPGSQSRPSPNPAGIVPPSSSSASPSPSAGMAFPGGHPGMTSAPFPYGAHPGAKGQQAGGLFPPPPYGFHNQPGGPFGHMEMSPGQFPGGMPPHSQGMMMGGPQMHPSPFNSNPAAQAPGKGSDAPGAGFPYPGVGPSSVGSGDNKPVGMNLDAAVAAAS